MWDVYLSLQRWRGASGMGGASPITLRDIADFELRYGYAFTAWETDVLKALDLAQLTASMPAPTPTPPASSASSPPQGG